MIKVLYHGGCCDGFCAAWVIHRKHPDAKFIPVTYNKEPLNVTENDDIIIVDFSYSRKVLEEMKAKVKSLIVLDHHLTAEKELFGLPYCIFDLNKSGCMLAWDHFFGHEPPPFLVEYCQDYDLWKHELPYSKEINAAIRSYPFDFETWDNLSVGSLRKDGIAILRYQNQLIEQACRHIDFINIGGHLVPAVHTTVLPSEIGNKLSENCVFSATWYMKNKTECKFSLRSRGDFDVSEIARSLGGGGHKNAAGFSINLEELR